MEQTRSLKADEGGRGRSCSRSSGSRSRSCSVQSRTATADCGEDVTAPVGPPELDRTGPSILSASSILTLLFLLLLLGGVYALDVFYRHQPEVYGLKLWNLLARLTFGIFGMFGLGGLIWKNGQYQLYKLGSCLICMVFQMEKH